MIKVEPCSEPDVRGDLRRLNLAEILVVHPLDKIADDLFVDFRAQRTDEGEQSFG